MEKRQPRNQPVAVKGPEENKSEIRMSKSETNSKSEKGQKTELPATVRGRRFEFCLFKIVSDFDIRISDFRGGCGSG